MSYADAQAQPVGFALDLCALVTGKVKQTLGLTDLKIAYQPVTAANAILLLKSGTIDIDCGATQLDAAHGQEAAFSRPILCRS